jgi:hypothetical protein
MSFTAEQKTQLAKLMATENLTVQHQKMQTAKFDPQNRILYLPIWQNMSGYMYDLLCGHEVGHALYTPAEGWHNAVTCESKGKSYKSFLNVVEDARIEKKVKRRYPGLRTSFQQGYKELMTKDFFGLNGRDINKMSFIDRLNLFTKSQYTSSWIEFTAQEMMFVRQVENLETWEDVIRVTDEIYEYSKNEQAELNFDEMEISLGFDNPDGTDDEYEEMETDEDVKTPDEESDDGDENSGSFPKKDDEEMSDEGYKEQKETPNRFKDSKESHEDQFNPNCETDENYRRNESILVDDKCKEYVYVDLPKPILKNIITPAQRVHEYLTTFFNSLTVSNPFNKAKFSQADMTKWVNEFKSKNERYIGLLAKEFEMRKAAKAFSKSKLSDTGDIDVNKIASYKFDDNIFRKVMLTPKGKNHGLVLLLDKSGSMGENMPGSIEQILVLSMFCRKVNIPFIVYGFGDSVEVRRIDTGKDPMDFTVEKTFTQNIGEVSFSNVYLREYLNSNMSNAQFSQAVKNLILVKKSFEKSPSYYQRIVERPDTEHLSNTPLTQAIVAVAEIMKDFKRKNNLDLTSLIIVHDGDADWTRDYIKEVEHVNALGNIDKKTVVVTLQAYEKNVIVCDKVNKYEFKVTSERSSMNDNVLQWFQKTTSSKVFGFYLAQSKTNARNAIDSYYVDEDGCSIDNIMSKQGYDQAKFVLSGLVKKFQTQKFIESKTKGYSSFFIVSGGDGLKTEDDELEIQGNVTTSKLKTAFMKMNKKKAINRILVSKFIAGIAA